ncbi:MAG: response regulator [Desulfobacteraceae bacterium]|nr:response regulator [Desulfobacteraceae bacterium]
MESEHKILVVDDDPVNVDILREILEDKYRLQIAKNGEEALDIAPQFMPDLILLDIMMPGIDGYEVCRRIRASNWYKFSKIILISAKAMKEERLKGYEVGADDYITKPFVEEELEAKIRVYLKLKSAEEVEKIKSEALARLESVVRHTPMVGIKSFDKNGIIRLWNRICEKMYGIRAEEVIGLHFMELPLAESSLAALGKNFEHVSETGMAAPSQIFEIQTKMNDSKQVYSTMFPVFESGSVREIFSMDVDVSHLKQKEPAPATKPALLVLEGAIRSMSMMMEAKISYYSEHQRRVSELASAMSDEICLEPEKTAAVRLAAMVHDIGYMTVPIEILHKPGSLSEAELNFIRAHSMAGYIFLKPLESPYPIADIVLQHHERMNGSGYPQGLSGDDIMIEAAIIAVADVVEAICSSRPYRSALGLKAAMEEINANKGKLYHPEAVNACLKLFLKKGYQFDKKQ